MFLLILFVILCYVFYCELNDLKKLNKIYEEKINILTEQVGLFLKIEKIYLQKCENLEFQNKEILRVNEEKINLIRADVENILLNEKLYLEKCENLEFQNKEILRVIEEKINLIKMDIENILLNEKIYLEKFEKLEFQNKEILRLNEEKINLIKVDVENILLTNDEKIKCISEDLEEVKTDIENNLMVNIYNSDCMNYSLFIHIFTRILTISNEKNTGMGCTSTIRADKKNFSGSLIRRHNEQINLSKLTNLEHLILNNHYQDGTRYVFPDNLENLKKLKYLTFFGGNNYIDVIKSSSLEEIKFDMILSYFHEINFLKKMDLPNLKKVIFRKCNVHFTKNEFMEFYENKYELIIDN